MAAAGLIAALPESRARAQTSPRDRLGPIGVQLYTLRALMKKENGVARTLAAVAKAGYKEVEFAGYFGVPAPRIRRMLDDNGLTSPSAHVSMENLGPLWEIFLEDANVLGQKYLFCAWIDANQRTPDGYRKVAQRFNEAGLKARGENIHFGYHNHAFEFTPMRGQTGYEILLRECDPLNLAMEADIFWMRSAGQNPLEWFAKYPGRFHALHVKDMGPRPRNAMVDVGKGVIDWRSILARRNQAGVRHIFVEHDEPRDPVASITSSYRYLRALRFRS